MHIHRRYKRRTKGKVFTTLKFKNFTNPTESPSKQNKMFKLFVFTVLLAVVVCQPPPHDDNDGLPAGPPQGQPQEGDGPEGIPPFFGGGSPPPPPAGSPPPFMEQGPRGRRPPFGHGPGVPRGQGQGQPQGGPQGQRRGPHGPPMGPPPMGPPPPQEGGNQ